MDRMVRRLALGDCDAVGSALLWPDGRAQSFGGVWRTWFARAVGIGSDGELRADHKDIEGRLSYLSGASMMVGRRFLHCAGLMREDYFLYCEEVEWCLRATKRQMRLGSAPGAFVTHYHGTTTGNDEDPCRRSRLSVYLLERNGILLTRDLFPHWLPVALATSLVILCLKYGRSGAWRQLGHGFAGWVAGLLNQRGPPKWLMADARN
jgi:N-acetylglucosaminyl-diphospho-decaprenol L-rhamnosyltransferase